MDQNIELKNEVFRKKLAGVFKRLKKAKEPRVPYEDSAHRFVTVDGSDGWQCQHCDKCYLDRQQQHEAHMCCSNDFACQTPECDNRLVKADRHRTMCDDCRTSLHDKVWKDRERKKWDGKSMVFSDTLNKFFSTPDEAWESLEEPQVMEDLRLMLCEPTWVPTFDLYDLIADSLPEGHDGYIPGGVNIEKKVNDFIEGLGVLGWEQSNYALDISEYNEEPDLPLGANVFASVLDEGSYVAPPLSHFESSMYSIHKEALDIHRKQMTAEDSWHTHFHRAAMAHPATEIMDHLRKGVLTTGKAPYDIRKCYHQIAAEMLDRRKKDRPLLNIEFIKEQSGLKKLLETKMLIPPGTVTGRINCSKPNLSNQPRPKNKCVCELNLVMNQGCKCGGS